MDSNIQQYAQRLSEFILKTKYYCKNCLSHFEYSQHLADNPVVFNPICPKCQASGNKIVHPEKSRGYIRNLIFRIRQKNGGNDRIETEQMKKDAELLKMIISSQFKEIYHDGKLASSIPIGMIKMSWDNFSFIWDVGVMNPLQVIEKNDWKRAGGGYNILTGLKSPPAFTCQE